MTKRQSSRRRISSCVVFARLLIAPLLWMCCMSWLWLCQYPIAQSGGYNPQRTGLPRGYSRVLLATPELAGPCQNGGIGTAMKALALHLASMGHEVSVLLALGPWSDPESGKSWIEWVEEYRSMGVQLVSIPVEFTYEGGDHIYVRRSYEVYLWLKQWEGKFDVVHFPDWQGIGFFTTLAKHQGLYFENTELVVQAHGPSMWTLVGNEHWPESTDFLHSHHLERKAIEWCDVLMSPSDYMVQFMAKNFFKLPSVVTIMPNFMLKQSPITVLGTPLSSVKVHELVFFGRIERRKGIFVFLDALQLLMDHFEVPHRVNVTILGKFVQSRDDHEIEERFSMLEINSRATNLRGGRWHIITTFSSDAAVKYISEPGKLVVIPSISENSPLVLVEALSVGASVVAADVGGMRELLTPSCADDILFQPRKDDLASMLERILRSGPPSCSLLRSTQEIKDMWNKWHVDLSLNHVRTLRQSKLSEPAFQLEGGIFSSIFTTRPMISVIIATYNPVPSFLEEAIQSLERQNYPARSFEVILVDDGSTQPESLSAIEALLPLFQSRGWTRISIKNSFLGYARNIGVQHSKGDFLMFMDDDNVAKPNEISSYTSTLLRVEADVMTCAVEVFFPNETPANASWAWFPTVNSALSLFENTMGDANFIVKRSVFEALGGFSTDRLPNEDWEFLTKAVLHNYKVEVLPEFLFWKRHVSKSMGKSSEFTYFQSSWRVFRPFMSFHDSTLGLLVAKSALTVSSDDKPVVISTAKSFAPIQGYANIYYVFRERNFMEWLQLDSKVPVDKEKHGLRFSHTAIPWITIGETFMHPSHHRGKAYLAARMWISNLVGRAKISGYVTVGTQSGGDGIKFIILKENEEIRSFDLNKNSTFTQKLSETIEVEVGTKLYFVCDPKQDDLFDAVWVEVEMAFQQPKTFEKTH